VNSILSATRNVVDLVADGDIDSDSDSLDGWIPLPEYDSSADEWEETLDPWVMRYDGSPVDDVEDTEEDEEEGDEDNQPQAPSPMDGDGTRRPSDVLLAQRALSGGYFTSLRSKYKCRCRYNCAQKLSVAVCFDLLDDLWGDFPSTNLRRSRMYDILTDSWDKRAQQFKFYINKHDVCEMTYRMCLGIGPQSTMWKKLKRLVREGGDLSERAAPMKQNVNTQKYDRMVRWIKNFSDESCDRLPINDKGGMVQFVIPFLTVSEFFGEYKADAEENVGCRKTFSRAFNSMPHIRTMRCKGNFSTCAICDAASKLLANVKRVKRLTSLEKQVQTLCYCTILLASHQSSCHDFRL
jgi:hypothetical protein